MSKPIDQELLPCPFCGCQVGLVTGLEYHTVRGDHSLECPFLDAEPVASAEEWNTRAAVQPAGVAVPEAEGTMIKIAAALCTVALREIESAMDSPRLSRAHLENALAACKDRLGGYAIDLRRAAAPHPVRSEQKPANLRFPTMLRKMWSGGEVQEWIDRQGPLYAYPPVSQDVAGLVEALEDITNDYAERFDMDSPSTNPGMKVVVENARAALAAHRAQQGEQPS